MKQVYAVLVLGLLAVFTLGSVASAGVIRYEDYERPTDNPFDAGDLDDDHPWGGDRIIGEGSGGDRINDGYGITITPTNNLYIDLLLAQLYRLLNLDMAEAPTTTTKYGTRVVTERSYRISPRSSTTKSRLLDGKVVSR